MSTPPNVLPWMEAAVREIWDGYDDGSLFLGSSRHLQGRKLAQIIAAHAPAERDKEGDAVRELDLEAAIHEAAGRIIVRANDVVHASDPTDSFSVLKREEVEDIIRDYIDEAIRKARALAGEMGGEGR